MSTVTIPAVRLVSAGTRGSERITPADIASMAAGYADKVVDNIPVKIGPVNARFQAGDAGAAGDGNPAYGWVENVRASSDGQTLVGDIVGVPAKLAPAMKFSLSNRVVEIEKGRRVGGITYRALLRGVAMVGMPAPALKALDDVLASFSHGQLITLTERTPQMDTTQADTTQADTDRAVATFAGVFESPTYRTIQPPAPPVVDPDDARAARSFNQW